MSSKNKLKPNSFVCLPIHSYVYYSYYYYYDYYYYYYSYSYSYYYYYCYYYYYDDDDDYYDYEHYDEIWNEETRKYTAPPTKEKKIITVK